jgi:hypothetical protein
MDKELTMKPEKSVICAKKIAIRVIHKHHVHFQDFDHQKNAIKPLLFFPEARRPEIRVLGLCIKC